MMDSAVTLLPEPDSPTTATVCRAPMSKLTLRTTAFHSPCTRNEVVSSRIARTGGLSTSATRSPFIARP